MSKRSQPQPGPIGFLLPLGAGVQCPDCGVPTEAVAVSQPYSGTVRLDPCGHHMTPGDIERSWSA